MPEPQAQHRIAPLSILIPTLQRGEILLNTIQQLLEQQPAAAEILILDQTPSHEPGVAQKLQVWDEGGQIRWLRLCQPSQPAALNVGIQAANQPILLCLDDDIRIEPGFLAAHLAPFQDHQVWAAVGQILQPGEEPLQDFQHRPSADPLADMTFPFRSAQPAWVSNGMSGNMAIRRVRALELGGFDENFLPPVSFHFESDFCKRLIAAGGRIRFTPQPRIHHLRAQRGGTRSLGSHLTSASPIHGQGAYYFALRRGLTPSTLRFILRRPLREVLTRFHLRHPWWIPVKLLGELRAFLQALLLSLRGPRLISDELRP